jgi:thioredoxin-related protein
MEDMVFTLRLRPAVPTLSANGSGPHESVALSVRGERNAVKSNHERLRSGALSRNRKRRICTAMQLFACTLIVSLLSLSATAHAATADQFFGLNMGDLKTELADARAEGKRGLLLFFEQEGCPGCRHMKQNILNRGDVQAYYGQNFVSFPIDVHSSVPITDFAGHDLTEKSYSQALKVRATPTFIFYDLTGAEVVRIVGPLQTPQEFLLLGQFVTSGAYKTSTFAQYKAAEHR